MIAITRIHNLFFNLYNLHGNDMTILITGSLSQVKFFRFFVNQIVIIL